MPFWESPVFWGVVGVIGVIVGVCASAIFSFIWANRKVMEHYKKSSLLITKDISNVPGLMIAMNGQPIQNLTVTTITFTNAGNQALSPSDFAKAEPLGARLTGAQYGFQVSSKSPNALPVAFLMGNNAIQIEFDFLKPKESLTLIVWHDGDISACGELRSGRIREGRKKRAFAFFFPVALMLAATAMSTVLISMLISDLLNISAEGVEDVSFVIILSLEISSVIILIPVLIFLVISAIKADLSA